MPEANVTRHAIEEEGRTLNALRLKLQNAVLIFFYEGSEERLGTMAMALPAPLQTPFPSSVLVGHKNAELARILAEVVCNLEQKMTIVSVNVPAENDPLISKTLLKLAKKFQTSSP